MVDTSLNKKYEAKESKIMSFEPAPEDNYSLKVTDISDWKETVKDIQVIQKDEDGNELYDEKGEKVRELEKGVKYYTAKVTLEIVGGEHAGKRCFFNLTTHPNMDYTIPNFLYGVGLDDLAASEIKEAVGKICNARVIIEEYEKTIQNKETGLDETVTRKVNKVKYFTKPSNITETEEFEDFGI